MFAIGNDVANFERLVRLAGGYSGVQMLCHSDEGGISVLPERTRLGTRPLVPRGDTTWHRRSKAIRLTPRKPSELG